MDYGGYGGGYGYDDGGGGGGFLQQQNHVSPGGGAMTDQSPGGGKRRDGAQKPSTLSSVTIKQLAALVPDPAGDGFSLPILGDLHSVRIIGRIIDLLEEPGKTMFSIDDGTAKVHLVYFFSDDDDPIFGNIREYLRQRGTYIDVVAALKQQSGMPLLNLTSAKLVTDYNQITTHFLECMAEHLVRKYGPITGGAAAGGAGPGAAGVAPGVGARYGSAGVGFGGGMGMGAGGVAPGGGGMDAVTAAVFKAFQEEGDSDDGATVDAVIARLRSTGYSRAQIESAIQTLTSDGFIYSTIDEQHYRATS